VVDSVRGGGTNAEREALLNEKGFSLRNIRGYFGIVLVPLVVGPGVVVAVPGALVAPAGTLVDPPAGMVFVPPAGGKPELKSPEAPRFRVPELLPAVEGLDAETPVLRLIPGLPTALGLLKVPPLVPLLTFEFPAVPVPFVPATLPVGAAGVP
jgi:hypothetical protein